MIELLTGLLICYVCNVLEKERKQRERIKKMKQTYFTNDKPKYVNV
jgi:hypothetical protein